MEHYEGIFKLKMLFHHEGKEEYIQSFCNSSSEQHREFRENMNSKTCSVYCASQSFAIWKTGFQSSIFIHDLLWAVR